MKNNNKYKTRLSANVASAFEEHLILSSFDQHTQPLNIDREKEFQWGS